MAVISRGRYRSTKHKPTRRAPKAFHELVGRLDIRSEPEPPHYADSTKISIALAWKRWTQ